MKRKPGKAKKLKHKRYTKVRVSSDGRREVYDSNSGEWILYAAVAYMLLSSDKTVAQSCDTESHQGVRDSDQNNDTGTDDSGTHDITDDGGGVD